MSSLISTICSMCGLASATIPGHGDASSARPGWRGAARTLFSAGPRSAAPTVETVLQWEGIAFFAVSLLGSPHCSTIGVSRFRLSRRFAAARAVAPGASSPGARRKVARNAATGAAAESSTEATGGSIRRSESRGINGSRTARSVVHARAGRRSLRLRPSTAASRRCTRLACSPTCRLRRDGTTLVVVVKENPLVNRVVFEGNHKLTDEQLRAEVQTQAALGVHGRTGAGRPAAHPRPLCQAMADSTRGSSLKIIQLDQNRVDVVFEINDGD